jgi:hypothetical protein
LALIVPVPAVVSEPPVPTVIAAVVFEPVVMALNAGAPAQPDPDPATTPEVLTCRHCVEPVIVLIVTPVAVAAPMFGVTKVGEVAKTSAPDPVSPVTAVARLALDGVARKVATPAPRPEIPVLTGKPVKLVAVPDAGVPSAIAAASALAVIEPVPLVVSEAPVPTVIVAVVLVLVVIALKALDPPAPHVAPESVIEVEVAHWTQWPEVMAPDWTGMLAPESVAAPVPPLARGKIPVTPVVSGSPVRLVAVPDAGVPSAIPALKAFAVTVPLPVGPRLEPVPTSMAAVVFVLAVKALNAVLPPAPHPAPESSIVVEFSHSTQWPEVIAPLNTGMLAPARDDAPVPPCAGKRMCVEYSSEGSSAKFSLILPKDFHARSPVFVPEGPVDELHAVDGAQLTTACALTGAAPGGPNAKAASSARAVRCSRSDFIGNLFVRFPKL